MGQSAKSQAAKDQRTAKNHSRHVALNVLLAREKDEVLAVACKEAGLAYRRVRAGKAHPGAPVRMDRNDVAPDAAFNPSWEIVDPNKLGKQVITTERGIFMDGDHRLTATRANGRPLADLR